jgi:hypothetical protein
MSEMTTRVAAALEQAFKDRVAATAGQPFEATGVTAPGFDVWEAYARAAIDGLRLALEEDLVKTKSFRSDRHLDIDDFLEDVLK